LARNRPGSNPSASMSASKRAISPPRGPDSARRARGALRRTVVVDIGDVAHAQRPGGRDRAGAAATRRKSGIPLHGRDARVIGRDPARVHRDTSPRRETGTTCDEQCRIAASPTAGQGRATGPRAFGAQARQPDAGGERERMLTPMSTAVNASIAAAADNVPARSRDTLVCGPRARSGLGGSRVIRAHENVRVEGLLEVSRVPGLENDGTRPRRELAVRRPAPPRTAKPRAGTTASMSSPTLKECIWPGDDDFAIEARGQSGNCLWRAVPGRCDHDQVRPTGDFVRGAGGGRERVPPLLTELGPRSPLRARPSANNRHRHTDRRQPGGEGLARPDPSLREFLHPMVLSLSHP